MSYKNIVHGIFVPLVAQQFKRFAHALTTCRTLQHCQAHCTWLFAETSCQVVSGQQKGCSLHHSNFLEPTLKSRSSLRRESFHIALSYYWKRWRDHYRQASTNRFKSCTQNSARPWAQKPVRAVFFVTASAASINLFHWQVARITLFLFLPVDYSRWPRGPGETLQSTIYIIYFNL